MHLCVTLTATIIVPAILATFSAPQAIALSVLIVAFFALVTVPRNFIALGARIGITCLTLAIFEPIAIRALSAGVPISALIADLLFRQWVTV